MRGLTSIGEAILLMAIAGWTFADKGVNAMSLALAAGSCVLLYRGIQGEELQTSAGDAVGTFEFVRDPGGTIVDSAYDTIGDFLNGDDKKAEPAQSTSTPRRPSPATWPIVQGRRPCRKPRRLPPGRNSAARG